MTSEQTAREDLAAALRLAAHFGFNEGICNHFSLQFEDGRFLLNPHGLHWSLIASRDLLLIDPRQPVSEAEISALNIHGAIHRQEEDAACVLHTHMPWATALTCIQSGRLRYVHQNSLRFFDDVAYDDDYNGLAESAAEGERIASCIQGKRVLFMANHGVVVVGASVADAFDRMYYLERACELQVKAMSTGIALKEIDAQLGRRTRSEFDAGASYAQQHFAALKRLLD